MMAVFKVHEILNIRTLDIRQSQLLSAIICASFSFHVGG